jgi:putative transposase
VNLLIELRDLIDRIMLTSPVEKRISGGRSSAGAAKIGAIQNATLGFMPAPMKQMARNVTMEGIGALRDGRYLLHDRDTKYTASFLAIIESARVKTLRLPARSPNLNAYSERWVRSAKEECLSKLILFGERSLRRAMSEYVVHYHAERNHQGRSNVLLFPRVTEARCDRVVECRERLGGLLRYYHRDAA